ncbi:hypothetical protein QYE76_062512 [Lolium multiflorum]|uniref:Uncharacterized protein n=1 Tax=Lolium multiflorum TaxID=4521 RepID=A0AAD8S3B6_LOLMU|nr:hypothetical protein QYE76_062512 [Lolium multiflorum]
MSSLKFDLPQLDYTTRFSLWQVKMRAILTQSSDLDEALDGFGKKDAKTWTDDEKRKDRKAFSLIQLHLSNNILQEVLAEKSAAALWLKLESICMSKDLTSKMHVKMKLFSHKLQEEKLQGRRRHRETPIGDRSLCSAPAGTGNCPGAISIDTTAIFIAIAVSYDEEGVVLPRG